MDGFFVGQAQRMNPRTGESLYAAVRRSKRDPRVLKGIVINWEGRKLRFYAQENDSPEANLVAQLTEWSPEVVGATPPTPEALEILRLAHTELGKPAELNPLASFFEEEL